MADQIFSKVNPKTGKPFSVSGPSEPTPQEWEGLYAEDAARQGVGAPAPTPAPAGGFNPPTPAAPPTHDPYVGWKRTAMRLAPPIIGGMVGGPAGAIAGGLIGEGLGEYDEQQPGPDQTRQGFNPWEVGVQGLVNAIPEGKFLGNAATIGGRIANAGLKGALVNTAADVGMNVAQGIPQGRLQLPGGEELAGAAGMGLVTGGAIHGTIEGGQRFFGRPATPPPGPVPGTGQPHGFGPGIDQAGGGGLPTPLGAAHTTTTMRPNNPLDPFQVQRGGPQGQGGWSWTARPDATQMPGTPITIDHIAERIAQEGNRHAPSPGEPQMTAADALAILREAVPGIENIVPHANGAPMPTSAVIPPGGSGIPPQAAAAMPALDALLSASHSGTPWPGIAGGTTGTRVGFPAEAAAPATPAAAAAPVTPAVPAEGARVATGRTAPGHTGHTTYVPPGGFSGEATTTAEPPAARPYRNKLKAELIPLADNGDSVAIAELRTRNLDPLTGKSTGKGNAAPAAPTDPYRGDGTEALLAKARAGDAGAVAALQSRGRDPLTGKKLGKGSAPPPTAAQPVAPKTPISGGAAASGKIPHPEGNAPDGRSWLQQSTPELDALVAQGNPTAARVKEIRTQNRAAAGKKPVVVLSAEEKAVRKMKKAELKAVAQDASNPALQVAAQARLDRNAKVSGVATPAEATPAPETTATPDPTQAGLDATATDDLRQLLQLNPEPAYRAQIEATLTARGESVMPPAGERDPRRAQNPAEGHVQAPPSSQEPQVAATSDAASPYAAVFAQHDTDALIAGLQDPGNEKFHAEIIAAILDRPDGPAKLRAAMDAHATSVQQAIVHAETPTPPTPTNRVAPAPGATPPGAKAVAGPGALVRRIADTGDTPTTWTVLHRDPASRRVSIQDPNGRTMTVSEPELHVLQAGPEGAEPLIARDAAGIPVTREAMALPVWSGTTGTALPEHPPTSHGVGDTVWIQDKNGAPVPVNWTVTDILKNGNLELTRERPGREPQLRAMHPNRVVAPTGAEDLSVLEEPPAEAKAAEDARIRREIARVQAEIQAQKNAANPDAGSTPRLVPTRPVAADAVKPFEDLPPPVKRGAIFQIADGSHYVFTEEAGGYGHAYRQGETPSTRGLKKFSMETIRGGLIDKPKAATPVDPRVDPTAAPANTALAEAARARAATEAASAQEIAELKAALPDITAKELELYKTRTDLPPGKRAVLIMQARIGAARTELTSGPAFDPHAEWKTQLGITPQIERILQDLSDSDLQEMAAGGQSTMARDRARWALKARGIPVFPGERGGGSRGPGSQGGPGGLPLNPNEGAPSGAAPTTDAAAPRLTPPGARSGERGAFRLGLNAHTTGALAGGVIGAALPGKDADWKDRVAAGLAGAAVGAAGTSLLFKSLHGGLSETRVPRLDAWNAAQVAEATAEPTVSGSATMRARELWENMLAPFEETSDAIMKAGGGTAFHPEAGPSRVAVIAGGQGGRVDVLRAHYTKIGEEARAAGLDGQLNAYLNLHGSQHLVGTLEEKALKALKEGDTWHANDYLERMMKGEALPMGLTPDELPGLFHDLQAKMTPAQWATVQDLGSRVFAGTRRAWQDAWEAGLITDEVYQMGIARPNDFIPMNRVLNAVTVASREARGTTLQLKQQGVLFSAEGADLMNKDPLTMAFGRHAETVLEAGRNEAVWTIKAFEKQHPIFGRYVQELVPGAHVPTGYERVGYYDHGERRTLIMPEVMARSLLSATSQDITLIGKALRKTASLVRQMAVVTSPGFAIANGIKDIRDTRRLAPGSYFQRGPGNLVARYNPVDLAQHIGEFVQNVVEAYKQGPAWEAFMNSRAGHGTLARTLQEGEMLRLGPGTLKDQMLGGLAHISNAIEEGSKMTGYARAKAAGLGETEAAYLVRRKVGSPDYARAGVYGRQMGSLMIFFNSQVQGISRLANHVTEDPKALIPALIGVGATALGRTAWNARFTDSDGVPSADRIPISDKQNYFFVVSPETYEKDGLTRHTVYKIPKGHVDQVLVNPVERAIEGLFHLDSGGAEDAVMNLLTTALPGNVPLDSHSTAPDILAAAANATNPLFKMPIAQFANRDLAYGAPIVPKRMEGSFLDDQVGPNTSPTIARIGHGINAMIGHDLVSPLRLQAGLKDLGLTSGLGEMALAGLDALQGAPPAGQPGTAERLAAPVTRRFVGSALDQRTRNFESRFYRALELGKASQMHLGTLSKGPDARENMSAFGHDADGKPKNPRLLYGLALQDALDPINKDLSTLRDAQRQRPDDERLAAAERQLLTAANRVIDTLGDRFEIAPRQRP